MITALDVAKYITSQMSLMGDVQLQKLVYYSQAWSLAWDGRPLFDDRIEAWRMGPVVPSIRHRDIPADPDALPDARARATVDAVLEFYGRHHGQRLASMSHDELPWKAAWGDRSPRDAGNDPIEPHLMRTFYAEQSIAGAEGPRRLTNFGQQAEDGSVEDAAADAAEQWAKTLHLLSQ